MGNLSDKLLRASPQRQNSLTQRDAAPVSPHTFRASPLRLLCDPFRVHVRARHAVHCGWICSDDRARRHRGKTGIQGSPAYAEACLRLRPGQQATRELCRLISGHKNISTPCGTPNCPLPGSRTFGDSLGKCMSALLPKVDMRVNLAA
jgi:hypothetical protein